MPGSMLTQHSASYPHYSANLASPNDLPVYPASSHSSGSKNSPTSLSGPCLGYGPSACKDDIQYRYSGMHDTYYNTMENYPPNKNQYDPLASAPLTKYAINPDISSIPLSPYNSANSNSTANHFSHAQNYQHSQIHNSASYPVASTSVLPHQQLSTENAHTPPNCSPQPNELNGMDKRWTIYNTAHARGWTPEPSLSTPPTSPNKSPSSSPPLNPANISPSEYSRTSPMHPTKRPDTQKHSPHSISCRSSIPNAPSPTPASSPSPSPPHSPTSAPSPLSSPPSSPRSGSKRRRNEQERREKHNDTERKGRQKINSEILVLKSLLPELQNSAAPKVSVLQCAVDTIKRRTEYANSMQAQNAHLRDENKSLKAEVQRLQHMLGMTTQHTQVPLHLHPVPAVPPTPIHHSSPNLHQPLEILEHNKRLEGYAFHGAASLIPTPSKQPWY